LLIVILLTSEISILRHSFRCFILIVSGVWVKSFSISRFWSLGILAWVVSQVGFSVVGAQF
jgi:hypothetical protein